MSSSKSRTPAPPLLGLGLGAAFVALAAGLARAETLTLGATPLGDGNLDGWNSNLVIHEGAFHTNTSNAPETVEITSFSFFVGNARGRVTPFVVRLNDGDGDGDLFNDNAFTVLDIGTTRVAGDDYAATGVASVPFDDEGSTLVLAPGESIAPGMVDANPDRSGGAGSVIPFSGNVPAGQMWYNGGSAPGSGDPVTEGGTLSGAPVAGVENRNYQFSITLDILPAGPLAPTDLLLERTANLYPTTPAGTALGVFSAVDPNPGDAHVFTLVENPGDRFAIDGNVLRIVGAPPPPGTVSVFEVRATDGGGLHVDRLFGVSVVAADPPVAVTLSATSIAAGTGIGGLVGRLAATDPNAADTHVFTLVPGFGDDDNAWLAIEGGEVRLAAAPAPGTTQIRFRVRATDPAGLFVETSFELPVVEPSIRINEFLASNTGGLADEDGDASDWIELFNAQGSAVDLEGWFLTDDRGDPAKWRLPAVVVAPGEFLVVFASGKDRAPADGGELHANFQLDGSGEFLALVRPDGVTVADAFEPTPQFADVSFGVAGGGAERGFLDPTPGTGNGNASAFGSNAVEFSRSRGFQDAPFALELSATVPGSTIRFTTDGSKPTSTSGTVYDGPITVSPATSGASRGTRIIRALAVHPEALRSRVATHTYLFVNGTGDPASDGIVAQPVLRSDIRNHPVYGPLLDDALLAQPAVAITGGVPGSTEAERSIEFFTADGSEPGFQIDCGMKVVGGHSVSSPKNNFRLYFRGDYGDPKLRYPLFREHPYSRGAVEVFDRLNLRSGSHDTFFWLASPGNPPNSGGPQKGDAQYLRNRWIGDMQFVMGHESLHGRFVHVFVNGTYHGQYHLHEWPNDDFLGSYLPGSKSAYEYTNGASTAKSGSDGWLAAWGALKAAASAGFDEAARWIDLENLADYMVLNFYAGNPWDWNPNQNWMAGGPNAPDSPSGGWKFFGWDSDICFQDPGANVLDKTVPDGLFQRMMRHEEFRVLFRDRVFRHCFHGGALTPAAAREVFDHRAEEIRVSLVAETARWQGGASSPPWDRDGEWQTELDRMHDWFFPARTDRLLAQLRSRGWYPLEAPEFDVRGGPVEPGFRPRLEAPDGAAVWFTTDGSDPRLPGGGIHPAASSIGGSVTESLVPAGATWRFLADGSNAGAAWRAVAFDDAAWPAGPAELGYGEGDEATEVGFVDTDPDTFGDQRNVTTYFRHAFTITGADRFHGLTLELKRDDGAVVYLNGREIARSNMPDGTIDFDTRAAGGAPDDGKTFESFSLGAGGFTLEEGLNVVAVEIHQQSPASSDVSFDLALSADRPADPDGGIVITEAALVRARAFDGTDWSPLNEAAFTLVGTEPATLANATVSEIQYHPPGSAQLEFLEFRNLADGPVDFSGVTVSGAVDFVFPLGTVVPAGGHVVVVEDEAAFDAAFADPDSPWFFPDIRVAGTWDGSLSNGGENIAVAAADGTAILSVAYADGGAWPGRADGGGSSLELGTPEDTPVVDLDARNAWLAEGARWRPSSEYLGSPGREGSGPDNRVVVNEVLAHPLPPDVDRLELLNATDAPIAVGGWLLSDASGELGKFRLPAGTTIGPGGFLVLDEGDFNQPGNPDNPIPFALSGSRGDDVFLVEADASGRPLRFVDRVEFGASAAGESFGRWPDGTGDLHPMRRTTFGARNDSDANRVRCGPVVVSEIHYHPPGGDDLLEFIQVCNAGGFTEPLDGWRLRGDVDFDFPESASLAPGGLIVVVGFDPGDAALAEAFRTAHGLDAGVPLAGPWHDGGTTPATLGDGGGTIRLQRPDALVDPGDGTPPFHPMLAEDTVRYDDEAPWSIDAGGGGASLRRVDFTIYGDDPANWTAGSDPLAGAGFAAWAAATFPPASPPDDLLPGADPDDDGLVNLAEYAFVLDPVRADDPPPITIGPGPDGVPVVAWRIRPGAHDLEFHVAVSGDLITWVRDPSVIEPLDARPSPDGAAVVVRARLAGDAAAEGGETDRRFLRIEVESR